MKKKYFLNANIIDPLNSIEEIGGLIVGENGKIEAVGKKVNTNNIPSREKYLDLKGKHIIPGIVDMRVFVGEPGFEYKENFRMCISYNMILSLIMTFFKSIYFSLEGILFVFTFLPTASIFPFSPTINPPISSIEF